MMEAIVLAGGFGSRLREAVPDLPKPMAPIAGEPFLEILLRSLARNGFRNVIVSLGFMADKISSYFGTSFAGMQLKYVIEDNPLGTGGAVRLALSQCQEDHAFIFNGDTYLSFEASIVEDLWQRHQHPIILARALEDTSRYGRLLVSDGFVQGFCEKGLPGPGLINAGCYVLSAHQLDAWPLNSPFSLEKDFFVHAVKLQPVDVFETSGLFIDIGVPDDYQSAQELLAGVV
jgi:Nucleoside-diphosphate-sugar pyrophosphorylase involved in lipopolysaccharide biosynthesis/translation initiation factor 2B, gamma/epsilon subunits (eIF-2Bgamma/eIF-2Bepsilon)